METINVNSQMIKKKLHKIMLPVFFYPFTHHMSYQLFSRHYSWQGWRMVPHCPGLWHWWQLETGGWAGLGYEAGKEDAEDGGWRLGAGQGGIIGVTPSAVTMPGDHPPPPGTSGQALTPGLVSHLLAHLCLKTLIKISGDTGDTQRLI